MANLFKMPSNDSFFDSKYVRNPIVSQCSFVWLSLLCLVLWTAIQMLWCSSSTSPFSTKNQWHFHHWSLPSCMTFYRVFSTVLLDCPHIPIRTAFYYFPFVSVVALVSVTAELLLCSVLFICIRKETHGMTKNVKTMGSVCYYVASYSVIIQLVLRIIKLFCLYLFIVHLSYNVIIHQLSTGFSLVNRHNSHILVQLHYL